MKYLLQLEELAQFVLAISGMYYQPIQLAWWLWLSLFFLPDLGMLGYLVNTSVGAFTYNLVHHKFTAVAVLAMGLLMQVPVLVLAGLILYGHSSFDRMLGYGLKYRDAFKHTHLGWM